MAIFIFNVPARTMKRERFALAGVLVLTRTVELVAKQLANDFVILLQMVEDCHRSLLKAENRISSLM